MLAPSLAVDPGLFIRADGTTITTAPIPFQEGLSIPAGKKLYFGSTNTYIQVESPFGSVYFLAENGSSWKSLIFDVQDPLGYVRFGVGASDTTYNSSGVTHAINTGSGFTITDHLFGEAITFFSYPHPTTPYSQFYRDLYIQALDPSFDSATLFQIRKSAGGGGAILFNANTLSPQLNLGAKTNITITDANAFLVENAGGTDVFRVNTSTPGVTIQTLTGLLKGTSGLVSAASGGSDYEFPLTFNSPLTRSTNTISFNQAANFTWTGTQAFQTSDRQVLFGDNSANDFTLNFNQANDATIRWDSADETFYIQIAGAAEFTYPTYQGAWVIDDRVTSGAGIARFAFQAWSTNAGSTSNSCGGSWQGYQDSGGAALGAQDIYGGTLYNYFGATNARTFNQIFGNYVGNEFSVATQITCPTIRGIYLAVGEGGGTIATATDIISLDVAAIGFTVTGTTPSNSYYIKLPAKATIATNNYGIWFQGAQNATYRAGTQAVWSSAASILDFAANTTFQFNIGANPAAGTAGTLLAALNTTGGWTQSWTADFGLAGAWRGASFSVVQTRASNGGAGTGVNISLTTAQTNGTHNLLPMSFSATGMTSGQARGGFITLQNTASETPGLVGYSIGFGRGTSASTPAGANNEVQFLITDIRTLTTGGTSYLLKASRSGGAGTYPSTAYIVQGWGHYDLLDNNLWDIASATNKIRSIYVGTSATITSSNANALLIEETGGTDRFRVDTSAPAIHSLAPFNHGVAATTAYNFDIHQNASGKGIFWRPANTGVNPQLEYVGKDGLTSHIKVSAANTATVSSWVLFDIQPSLSGTVGRGISLPINIAIADSRTINASGLGFDAIRLFPMSVSRSSGFSSNQSGTHQLAGLYMTFGDAGTYSISTGGVLYSAYGMTADLGGMSPVFSATSGTNTLTFSLLTATGGGSWGGGNAQTTLAFRLIDLNSTYTQISGFAGAGAGGFHYGIHYRPLFTVVSGGAVTEAALRADRSGIILSSDGTQGTYGGGNIFMGASLDWELFFEADNEAVNDIPTGAVYDWRINHVDIISLAATALTLTDGVNFVGQTGTGHKLLTSSSQKLGIWGATPIARPSAYTQTYSTATKTHSNFTSVDLSTTAAVNITPWGFATQAQADAIGAQFNALRVDVANLKQVVNAIIDDQQAIGLAA